MKKKVSVIIPIFNVERFLKAAVDSLLIQQNYLHEIILIDDGSTDSSGELIDKLYSNNKIIRIIHTDNQGQGPARNLGTNLATGEYIYYFDADDIIKPGLFAEFNKWLNKLPTLEIFCFSAESFLDNNYSKENVKNIGMLSADVYQRKVSAECPTGEDAFNLLYSKGTFFAVPYLYIFKKSIIVDNNIVFREIRYEDEEFTQQLFIFGGFTLIASNVFYLRRIRDGSVMQKKRNFEDLLGYFKTTDTLKKLLIQNSLKKLTKENINSRILNFIRNIIIIKTTGKVKMNLMEKKDYLKLLYPFFFSKSKFIFSLNNLSY